MAAPLAASAWGTRHADAASGAAIRGWLFLLSIHADAAFPVCTGAYIEIRCLHTRIQSALSVSGCLCISDAARFLGRHRSETDRSEIFEAGVSCDAGCSAARD